MVRIVPGAAVTLSRASGQAGDHGYLRQVGDWPSRDERWGMLGSGCRVGADIEREDAAPAAGLRIGQTRQSAQPGRGTLAKRTHRTSGTTTVPVQGADGVAKSNCFEQHR